VRSQVYQDEFVLLCVLMQTSTHLVPLDQTASVATGNAAPDLLARFQPGFFPEGIPSSRHRGYRCLVEVKSRSRDEFVMSGGLFGGCAHSPTLSNYR
jgi:hypothetical protein